MSELREIMLAVLEALAGYGDGKFSYLERGARLECIVGMVSGERYEIDVTRGTFLGRNVARVHIKRKALDNRKLPVLIDRLGLLVYLDEQDMSLKERLYQAKTVVVEWRSKQGGELELEVGANQGGVLKSGLVYLNR